ncbi:MAG: hypothetical protein ABR524_10990 [Thermoanaerobaculia bacterium]
MKATLLWFALVLLAGAQAQAQSPRNAAYLELGGSAIGGSFNYERRFTEQWVGRAGLSWITGETSEGTDTTFIVPLTASHVNRPWSSHHMELGGGVTLVVGDRQDFWAVFDDDEQVADAFLTGIIGYRYQKPAGGFQFRAVLTPVLGDGTAALWGGVSFGYAW